jgi:hypothetical protein
MPVIPVKPQRLSLDQDIATKPLQRGFEVLVGEFQPPPGGTASAGRELGRWSVPSAHWSLDPRKASSPVLLLLTTLDARQ